MARVVSAAEATCRPLVEAAHDVAKRSEERWREVAETFHFTWADLRENPYIPAFDSQGGQKMWVNGENILCQPLTTYQGKPVGISFNMEQRALRDAVSFAGDLTSDGYNTVRVRGGELLLTPWNKQTRFVTAPAAPRAEWQAGQAMVQLFLGDGTGEMRQVNVTPDVFSRVLWRKYLADQVQEGQDGLVDPVKHLVGLLAVPEGPDAVRHFHDLPYGHIARVLHEPARGFHGTLHYPTGDWGMGTHADGTSALVVDPGSARRGHGGDAVYFMSRYAPGSPGDVTH